MPALTDPSDPWSTHLTRRHELLDGGERALLAAYNTAQDEFLAEARAAVLDPVTAGAGLDKVRTHLRSFSFPSRARWVELLRKYVLPALKRWYQRAWTAASEHTGLLNPPDSVWNTVEVEYEQVFQRDSWSDQLYAEMRAELDDSADHGDPMDIIAARLKRLFSPLAPVGRVRDAFVRRLRRGLGYDPELGDADYTHVNASRMRARWSTVGLANRAFLDAAMRDSWITGETYYKAWFGTLDERIRATHLHSHQQSVPLRTPFVVGGAELRFPGDPLGPPAEVANCRCVLVLGNRADHDRLNKERAMKLAERAVPTENQTAAARSEQGQEKPSPVPWRGMLAPLDTRADHRVIGMPEDGEVRVNRQMWLSHQDRAAPGHDGKVRIGRIDRAWITNGELWAEGVLNPNSETAMRVGRDIAEGFDGTVSVDLADATGEERYYDADGLELSMAGMDPEAFAAAHPDARKLTYFPSWRLSGATLVQDPAFHTGWVSIVDHSTDDRSVTASAPSVRSENDGPVAALASASPVDKHVDEKSWPERVAAHAATITEPSPSAFDDPKLPGPTKITVSDDGRVTGHIACWSTSHISYPGQSVTPPRSETGYQLFHRHPVRCSDGSRIRTGVLVMGTGHADLRMSTSSASAHYDHTGHIVADVRAGEDEHGIWVAGVLHPGVTPLQVMILDRYSLSGDWRGGELVSALVVNTPGFPIPNSLAASGEITLDTPSAQVRLDARGDQYALVAAGMLDACPVSPSTEDTAQAGLRAELRELRSLIAAEQEYRRAAEQERAEAAAQARAAELFRRVNAPRIDRIAAFAASAGLPAPTFASPAPANKKPKPNPPVPPAKDTKGLEGTGDKPDEDNDAEATENLRGSTKDKADRQAKATGTKPSPSSKSSPSAPPDPKEIGARHEQKKAAENDQAQGAGLGLLEDTPEEAARAVPDNPGLLDDGDTGTDPLDFEVIAPLLDELDDRDIALIELLTGLPVHERLAELESAEQDPDGDNPPDLTSEIAQRQKESEDSDPLRQARKALDEKESAAAEGLGANAAGKKRPPSARPTVRADALIAAKAPNWVAKHGGLPKYVKRVAKHLKKKGFAESHAIATAINVVKKMCRNAGDRLNFPGAQKKVNGGSIAEACAAVAHWESMKAAAGGGH